MTGEHNAEAFGAGILVLAIVQAVGSGTAMFFNHHWAAGMLWATALMLLADFMGADTGHRGIH